ARLDVWAPAISTQYKGFQVEQFGSTEEIPVPDDLDYDLWLGPAPVSPYTSDRCSCFGAWHVYDNALGFIAGWGAHPLDIAQWGNDTDETAPIFYEGTGRLPEKGLFDTIESWDLHCEYANGVKMHFMDHRIAKPIVSGYRAYKEHGTTFFGSEGWISVDRGGLHASNPALLDIKLKDDDVHLYESAHQIGNFVDCIKSRKKTINPVESAVQSDMISHLGNACIRTGRPIKWDPAKEEIIGDTEAARMLDRPLRSPWQI
ncbi:MAG: gfo/Idh/MocA family oxidoreductase, partial [Candidatus Hydrogenedentes bacterium]|nr:gfo/Idh/MocA family oxidoreductase [Candidatus Hydrogenedentota bacterium]